MNQEDTPPADTWKPLTLDIDRYLSLLDDEDIPEDQKRDIHRNPMVDHGQFRRSRLPNPSGVNKVCGQNTDEELTASLDRHAIFIESPGRQTEINKRFQSRQSQGGRL